MSEEVPVNRVDLLALAVVSLVGGVVLAVLLAPVELTPEFISIVFLGMMLLAFFLFIPVMGARLFIDDWREE
ncbi:hypothetical protein [Natronorubrum daqingense]|uniref:Uncharacterized protein n=1 Tax=Natronorubrum daqingense TaxID=588898 RepID=A0A1N6Y7I0_9EURY|nr:hypothetical protein [Natronorubrum daqingense]APX95753.1 hypothetical protein BB347_03500 [Natronorubrum daqingense]SIR10476.1 hypothetical protein SAMN05421809_0343 [Natronorubrum daqingense]